MTYTPAIPSTRSYVGHFSAISYADIGSTIGITPNGSTPFTIEAWVRFAGLCKESCILSQENGFMFCNKGDQLSVTIPGFPTIYSDNTTTPLVPGEWLFVAFTFDGTNATVYIGGYSAGQQIIRGTPQTNSGSFSIGNNLQGDVQSVRIFSAARNATQILDDMFAENSAIIADADLQAFYDFGVYPPADQSSNSRPITMGSGAITVATTPGVSLPGTAYAKPLHDHDVNPGGGGNDPYTVQAWVLADISLPTQHIFVNNDLESDSGIAFFLTFDENANRFYVNSQRGTSATANILTSTTTIPLNQWVNLATTYDGSTLKIYINGVEDVSGSFGSITTQSESNLMIGASIEEGRPTGIHGVQGMIGNVDVWSTALSQTDIQTYMQDYPERQDNLEGLYSFIQQPARNEVNGNPIGLTDGAVLTQHVDDITAGGGEALLALPPFRTSAGEEETAPYDILDPTEIEEIRKGLDFNSFMDQVEDFAPIRNLETAKDIAAYFPNINVDTLQSEIDKKWDEVIHAWRNDPLTLTPITYHNLKDHHVLIRHTPDGSQVVFAAAEDTIDSCNLWRIQIIWCLISGLMAVFGVTALLTNKATDWINNNIIQNQALMDALTISPGATVTAVFFNLTLLQSYGVLVPLFKMVIKMLGWWALAAFLAKVFSFLVGAGAAVTIAQLIVAVTQLVYLYTQQPANCPLIPSS